MVQASPSRNKCRNCGLVNFATEQICRRCGSELAASDSDEIPSDEGRSKRRGFVRRLIWIFGATLLLLFVFYMSLRITSDDLEFDQRQVVQRAIAVLKQKGFAQESFVLSYLCTFRRTDNWWNQYMGHQDAYAATNFPFEVVTLYPEFFEGSVDDNERAAMLLHETYHLFGSGEEDALEGVWRNKQRLGWSAVEYSESKVWRNTRELTMNRVPKLFQCGTDGKSDCTE